MFSKILIANRGEIACRVIKTAQRMGIATVAVYSDADRDALHVRLADKAVRIGPPPSRDSYLRGDIILQVALETGAQAIHPGYGFLSENEAFAKACAKAGIVFIGPSPKAINAMGLKDKAKEIMAKASVPVVPGYLGEKQDAATLKREAEKIGYPVLIKAVAGGGGKGMRPVEKAQDFVDSLNACKREAAASFGNDHVMIEKYIQKPRHVEMQVFGDSHGNAVHLFERDCSLQRRHQKVVEEAPAPGLPDDVRRALGEAAVKAVKAIKYTNAGTIEFIMDSKTNEFFFMEMNTRLQVEHPVTEMITGQDLVEWQLRIAAGEALPPQSEIVQQGHAFEVRLYAEDPANQFLPQIGTVTTFIHPPVARIDSAVEEDDVVSIHYDPMIAKIIVHGDTRAEAIAHMHTALNETVLTGLVTNQEFLSHIFRHKNFIKGDVDTGFIARHEKDLIPKDYGLANDDDLRLAGEALLTADNDDDDIWSGGDRWRLNGDFRQSVVFANRGQLKTVTIGDQSPPAATDATIVVDGETVTIFRDGKVIHLDAAMQKTGGDSAGEGRMLAPMPGKIIDVMVKKGAKVEKDQPLLIMEAMKMQMTIRAAFAGIVDALPVSVGQQVTDGALLAAIGQKGL